MYSIKLKLSHYEIIDCLFSKLTFRSKECDESEHVSDDIHFWYDEHELRLMEQRVTEADYVKISWAVWFVIDDVILLSLDFSWLYKLLLSFLLPLITPCIWFCFWIQVYSQSFSCKMDNLLLSLKFYSSTKDNNDVVTGKYS